MTSTETTALDLRHARFDPNDTTLIKQAVLITGGPQGTLRGDLLLRDGMIADVGPHLDAGDAEVVDGSPYIVCAGFIDTHRHLWQSMYKGLVYDRELFDIFTNLYGTYSTLFRPEDIYAGTLLGRLCALEAGITTVLDWSHNISSTAMEDAGIQALRDAGGRSIFGHGYVGDRTVPSAMPRYYDVPRTLEAARRTRDLLPDDDALISSCYLGLEPTYFISMEACRKEFEVARELGMRISIHIASIDTEFAPFASLEAMHANGLMGDDVTYVHLYAANDHELRLIHDTGGTASICPQVDSHIFAPPPTGRLLTAGVRPSVSLDSAACGSEDFFSQMRALFDVERTVSRAGFQPRPEGYDLRLDDVFDFATVEGARAIGQQHRLGTLEPGKVADIQFIDTTSLAMMPVLDPIAAVVFHANTSDIDTVLVGGVPVKRDGRLVADTAAVRRQVEESADYLYWKTEQSLPPEAVRPHAAVRPLHC
ncbi:MAG TPA: hypothetical protein DIW80_01970 [Gordonia polyisoprenivorans]|nr:hypothetical protein [Gordonia polyisoprenivorans]